MLTALFMLTVSAVLRQQSPAWEITTSKSEMTDQLAVTLTLEDLGSLAHVPRRLLMIECNEGSLQIAVATGFSLHAIDDWTPVRLRWGNGPVERASWSISTDYQSAIAPESRPFVQQLLANPDLRIEVQTETEGANVIKFDARGLEQYIPALNAACPESPKLDRLEGVTLDSIYPDSVVEEVPVVLSGPAPEYPDLMRQARIPGRVIVEAIIGPNGRADPKSIKIVQSPNPAFDEPARRYVRRALFRPGRIHGLAVNARTTITVEFPSKQ